METTFRVRPNHYETLGLAPSAGSDEIARAFARESSVFRPHSFGGIAEVFAAYATLRDPAKRRAYDESIGLDGAAPTAAPEPSPFVHPVLGHGYPAKQSPFLLAKQPAPEPPERPFAIDPPVTEQEWRIAAGPDETGWKRTGITLGAIVAGACLLGGLAGWWSASDIGEAQPPAKAASRPLPDLDRTTESEMPPRPAPSYPVQARPEPARRAATEQRVVAAVRPATDEKGPRQDRPIEPPPIEPSSIDPVVEAAAAAPAASASLPLPSKVVARTIERIGYSCGSVTATTAVEGRPGVYNVTCASGQSYQAKPVNGRYRFKRLGR